MSRANARARVRRAQVELDAAEQQLARQWQPWRERIGRHRLSVLVGAGLFGGVAATVVSPQHWARVGAALFGGGAWLVRSAIGPAVLGALWTNIQSPSSSTRATAAASPVAPSA